MEMEEEAQHVSNDNPRKILDLLLKYCKVDITEKNKKASVKYSIASLVKRISNRESLTQFIDAVASSGCKSTNCSTISRKFDRGPGRKHYIHVLYTQIFRWPKVEKCDLKHIATCEFGYDLKLDEICVNPYHYYRISEKSRRSEGAKDENSAGEKKSNPMAVDRQMRQNVSKRLFQQPLTNQGAQVPVTGLVTNNNLIHQERHLESPSGSGHVIKKSRHEISQNLQTDFQEPQQTFNPENTTFNSTTFNTFINSADQQTLSSAIAAGINQIAMDFNQDYNDVFNHYQTLQNVEGGNFQHPSGPGVDTFNHTMANSMNQNLENQQPTNSNIVARNSQIPQFSNYQQAAGHSNFQQQNCSMDYLLQRPYSMIPQRQALNLIYGNESLLNQNPDQSNQILRYSPTSQVATVGHFQKSQQGLSFVPSNLPNSVNQNWAIQQKFSNSISENENRLRREIEEFSRMLKYQQTIHGIPLSSNELPLFNMQRPQDIDLDAIFRPIDELIASRTIENRKNSPPSYEQSIARNFQQLSSLENPNKQNLREELDQSKNLTLHWSGVGTEIMQYNPLLSPQPFPKYWCVATYHEQEKEVGRFKALHHYPSITIDGYSNYATDNKFSIGALRNTDRTKTMNSIIRHIQHGITLDLRGESDVWLRNNCKYSIYLQSDTLDMSVDRATSRPVVHNIHSSAYVKVFDLQKCYEKIQESVATASTTGKSIDDIRECCFFRLSFFEGWGMHCSIKNIEQVPCWMKVAVNRALQLLDDVLQEKPIVTQGSSDMCD